MICLSLTAPDFKENRKALTAYRPCIDLAELRVDRLRHDQLPLVADFMTKSFEEFGLSFVLTLRLIDDGGAWAHGESDRRHTFVAILQNLGVGVVSWVDLEAHIDWPDVESLANRAGAGIIRSYHNFSGVPADLESRMRGMYRGQGEVAKVAVMARGSADLLAIVTLAQTMRAQGRPFILLGMGPFGLATRILSRRLGSLFTFTSSALQGHLPAAPGHMDPQLLAEQFGFRRMSAATKIFGILGNPVMHSRSPSFHNTRFVENGVDAVYLPFQVDHLPSFFSLAERLEIQGCSVTIPHKEGVMAYLGSSDELVREIGSCNTMIQKAGAWHGTNTDAPGFFLPLAELLKGESRTRALVIGAGGAGRGVVQALLSHGFSVLVLNRTIDRARQLATDFEVWYPGMIQAEVLPARQADHGPWSVVPGDLLNLIRIHAQVIIQTTSIGMDSEDDQADPLGFYAFDGSEIVYDIIYTPPLTPLLVRARAAGCKILNGWPMFEEQARLQSGLFIEATRAVGS